MEDDDFTVPGAVTPPTQEVFDYSMNLRRRFVTLKSGVPDNAAIALFDEAAVSGETQWPDRSVIFDYSPYEVLSHVLEHRGWDERDGQIDMVEGIGDGDDLILDAPVGIGKTLGYLVPCLLNYSQFMVATRRCRVSQTTSMTFMGSGLSGPFSRGKAITWTRTTTTVSSPSPRWSECRWGGPTRPTRWSWKRLLA